MALATTCPQCKTSFRVVPDQLKLRRGFVRCGRCRNVFAGIDHLRYVDDTTLSAAWGSADVDDVATVPQALRVLTEVPEGEAESTPAQDPSAVEEDEEAIDSAIDYFSTRRSRGFADRRGLLTTLVAMLLAVTLVLQWVVAQRSAIAVRAPVLAPLLGAVFAPFGLRIEAPSELDALTIASFELQASAVPDVLEMRALLRNDADHPVRWPSMQLTLIDPSNRVLVRRTLSPDDYLHDGASTPDEAVPARTEWPLRLALETRELQLAGYDYRVRLFYP